MDFGSVKSSDLRLKDSETHATTQCVHAHIVVSPARQQCTALTSVECKRGICTRSRVGLHPQASVISDRIRIAR